MRKALTVFIIILLLPSLIGGVSNLLVLAASGGSSGNSLATFISTLQTLIPAALILLTILANRYDQRYALVLFAAAMASAIFLAALAAAGQTSISSYSPGNEYFKQLTISGHQTIYLGDSGTWTISGGV
jgi:hypothetical protein